MFDDIFDPDEYNMVKDKVNAFLKKEFGNVDTIRIGFYLFIFASYLLVDVCTVDPKWLGAIVSRVKIDPFKMYKNGLLEKEEDKEWIN